jgi:hypothetical protein
MDRQENPHRATIDCLRRKLFLRVVRPEEARGLVIPPRGGRIGYRGRGGTDYACGGCGVLLAIGVTAGMFQSLIFACACGALNQVPCP